MINPNCEYCGRHNPADMERCQACGAPLAYAPLPETRVTLVDEPTASAPEPALSEILPSADEMQEGLKAVGAVAGSLGIGAVILRVAAQGIAIAISTFLVGLAAGHGAAGLNQYLPHLLTALIGGALLGVVITLARKRTIWTLLAAPLGTFIAFLLTAFINVTGSQFPLAALITLAGALLFALIGGKRSRGKPLPCVKVLLPILGAIGGVVFALLGFYTMYRIY